MTTPAKFNAGDYVMIGKRRDLARVEGNFWSPYGGDGNGRWYYHVRFAPSTDIGCTPFACGFREEDLTELPTVRLGELAIALDRVVKAFEEGEVLIEDFDKFGAWFYLELVGVRDRAAELLK